MIPAKSILRTHWNRTITDLAQSRSDEKSTGGRGVSNTVDRREAAAICSFNQDKVTVRAFVETSMRPLGTNNSSVAATARARSFVI